MDAQDLVKRAIKRAQGGYHLPELTSEQVILWLDSLRMPEWIRDHAIYDRPGNRAQYTDTSDEYRERLALLEQEYIAGRLDAESYSRLSTIQDYPHEQLMRLRDEVHHFYPRAFGVHQYGGIVYTLASAEGTIYLTHENGVWIKHDDFPYSCFR